MKRRQYLAGLATTAGGSLMIGSGAFSSTTTERAVHIDVVRDSDAYLALRAEDTSIASGHLSGTLRFEISDSTLPGYSGDGVGPDSIYEFTGGDQDGVFSAQNQGTEDVVVYGQPTDDENEVDIHITAVGQPDEPKITANSPSRALTPGDLLNLGLMIDTYGVDGEEFPMTIETSLELVAERPV